MMTIPLNVDLTGKVAVVTGGGGVLGSYFAKALAEAGAKVAILDLTKNQLTQWQKKSLKQAEQQSEWQQTFLTEKHLKAQEKS